jgi:hypothetical protein
LGDFGGQKRGKRARKCIIMHTKRAVFEEIAS